MEKSNVGIVTIDGWRALGKLRTGVPINHVGHAEQWDVIDIDGEVGRKNCSVGYHRTAGRWHCPPFSATSKIL